MGGTGVLDWGVTSQVMLKTDIINTCTRARKKGPIWTCTVNCDIPAALRAGRSQVLAPAAGLRRTRNLLVPTRGLSTSTGQDFILPEVSTPVQAPSAAQTGEEGTLRGLAARCAPCRLLRTWHACIVTSCEGVSAWDALTRHTNSVKSACCRSTLCCDAGRRWRPHSRATTVQRSAAIRCPDCSQAELEDLAAFSTTAVRQRRTSPATSRDYPGGSHVRRQRSPWHWCRATGQQGQPGRPASGSGSSSSLFHQPAHPAALCGARCG